MSEALDQSIQLDSEPFFQIGRALQRGIGKGKLGTVTLSVEDGFLTISSDWGGGKLPCTVGSTISATLSAKSFCALITTRSREKQPAGTMKVTFRPSVKEVGIDRTGVKARFPS